MFQMEGVNQKSKEAAQFYKYKVTFKCLPQHSCVTVVPGQLANGMDLRRPRTVGAGPNEEQDKSRARPCRKSTQ